MISSRKTLILLLSFVLTKACLSQTITVGENSLLRIGSSSSFFVGGNTFFNGSLNNEGKIIGYSDLDFIDNDSIGNLQLVGADLQEIFGDSIVLEQLEVNSSANVLLQAAEVKVVGDLNVANGVIQISESSSLIVLGDFSPSEGFIEGSLTGFTKRNTVTFPMGTNGFSNYISLSNTLENIETNITCQVPPDFSTLLPTEDMVGISDEVEWIIQTAGETTNANISVDFSGLDFVNFSNGEAINADVYEPALVIFQAEDTIYHLLESVESTPKNGATNETEGRIVSEANVVIGPDPTKVAVAWIPIVDDPEFFVPNVFSPTGFYQDNRVFRPFFSGGKVSSISISIYNSFNQEIFSYKNSGEDLDLSLIGWDGKIGASKAVEGVYYYIIKMIADGQLYQKTSSVLLAN